MSQKMITAPRAVLVSLLAGAAVAAPAGAATTTTTTISPAASRFYINGGGYGHGVGMSQYGAAGFALHGYRYGQILSHYYSGTRLGWVNPNRTVTVLLHQGAAIFRGATAIVGSPKKLNAAYNYGVFRVGSRLRVMVGHHSVGTFAAPLIVHDKGGLHGTGAPLVLDGQGAYDGVFVFRPDGDGGVMTIDSVGVDDYVRGVVTAEMPSRWPAQALEAQAIAARTYAVAAPPATPDFDLYDDTRSQMYGNVSSETAAGNAAVAATSGKVVEYQGHPMVTYFFASSGGHTESVQNIWYNFAPVPWLRGVTDPYDDSFGNPYYHWTSSYTLAGAASRVRDLYKGTLEGIKITQTGVSPRIVRAVVVGTQGASTVTGFQLQRLFGTRSTYMSFTTLAEQGKRTKTTTRPASGAPRGRAGKAAKKVTIRLSVQGTIFPATRGLTVIAQRWSGVRWRSVARARLTSNGSYTILVKTPGTYRIASEGLDGPNIRVP